MIATKAGFRPGKIEPGKRSLPPLGEPGHIKEELQQAGKVRHIGVSNLTLEQLAVARSLCTVVSVQNAYNVGTRTAESLLADDAADPRHLEAAPSGREYRRRVHRVE